MKIVILIFTLLLINNIQSQSCQLLIEIESYGFYNSYIPPNGDVRLYENSVLVTSLDYRGFTYGRGTIIATYLNGARTDYKMFDTHGYQSESQEMINFIDAQPAGTLFVVGCWDECRHNMTSPGWAKLESIGFNPNFKTQYIYRGAYTLIGYVGANYLNQPQQLSNPPVASAFSEICAEVNYQYCYDHLGLLIDENIDNYCEQETVNDALQYNLYINYLLPFQFDDDCITQSLDINGNNWPFNFDGTQVSFHINHLDLETYGCTLTVDDDEYIWQCQWNLHIYYQGVEQLLYTFCFTSVLSRVYENELTVHIQKNEIIGDCCENTLHIDTEMNFCTTFACSAYLPNPITINRLDTFFIEQKITTVEFQYYYLHYVSLKIGNFYPVIIQQSLNIPGKKRYELKSNIAMSNQVIEAISRISEYPQSSRRALSSDAIDGEYESLVGDDYLLKDKRVEIKKEEREEIKQNSEDEEDSELSQGALIAIITCSVVGGLLIIASSLFCILKKKNVKSRKYESKTSLERIDTNQNVLEVESKQQLEQN